MSRAVVFLADGFEEVEALTTVDLLRRGNIEVVTMSISDSLHLIGRSRIEVTADAMFKKETAERADMVILPGGQPGTTYLGEHKGVRKILEKFVSEDKYVAAICAAPTVFAKYGILKGKRATCYPGLESELRAGGADVTTEESVVVDGKIVTSRGVGTAIPFALKLIELLADAETSESVRHGIVA